MAVVKPFSCIRPRPEIASRVAALPYDVYGKEEAREKIEQEPLSFLAIDFPEAPFFYQNISRKVVYQKAEELLKKRIKEGILIEDTEEAYYIYELNMDGKIQTGIAGCVSIDDYLNRLVKPHENTRKEKEQDRFCHINACKAQTGLVFLTYRKRIRLADLMEKNKKQSLLYDFTSADGISHKIWKVKDKEQIKQIYEEFDRIKDIYIADGHHRAAAAVRACMERRKKERNNKKEAPFNYFLSVLFPEDELTLFPYHRAVKDLNGKTKEQLLSNISAYFEIEDKGEQEVTPEKKKTFGMCLEKHWYQLTLKDKIDMPSDINSMLDVSILQTYLLEPFLGIQDSTTNKNIAFAGGKEGLEKLKKMNEEEYQLLFTLYPVSVQEIFDVADSGKQLPPKSTWFEPKLRSGLLLHPIEDRQSFFE